MGPQTSVCTISSISDARFVVEVVNEIFSLSKPVGAQVAHTTMPDVASRVIKHYGMAFRDEAVNRDEIVMDIGDY